MQAVLAILAKAGGWRTELYLKIDNRPFMELVIEAIGEGPSGLPAISIAHYGEQNGDLMRDPEVCFELESVPELRLNAFSWRNDHIGWDQTSRYLREGVYGVHEALHRQHRDFAALWDRNLEAQGYLLCFDPALHICG
jgi:hypothetical protein